MKVIAIIPARGGSKGINLKNIRDVCGKPLIYYQLKNALNSTLIDTVVLASDSDKILEVGRNLFGDKILLVKRPPKISTGTSKTEETLIYVLNQLQESFDVVVTLEPTNPLNTTEHIEKCIQHLLKNSCDAVCCGVKDYSFLLETNEDYQQAFLRPMKNKILPRIRECGNCWVTDVDALRTSNNRLGASFEYVVIPNKDSHHLDSEDDWIVIEAVMKQRRLRESSRYYKTRKREGKFDSNLYDVRYWKEVVDPDGITRDKTKERDKRISFCQEEIDYINSLKPGRVLDVGCGLGFLLSAIEPTWEKHGVEISEYAVDYAKRYGTVLCGVLCAAEYESNFFDVVMLNHVVEHFQNPVAELIEIRRVLKPRGKLILGTPDFSCELAKRFGNNFRLLHDRGHISLFSTISLYKLLTDLFFEIESVSYPFFETEYFTEENLLRLFDVSKLSPPFCGNVVTFYAYKK